VSAWIGLGGVVLGFLLAQLAVSLRDNAERGRRDQATLTVLNEELRANRESAENTRKLIASEFSAIQTGSLGMMNPLDLLQGQAWNLVIQNLPRRVAADADLLSELREYERLIRQVNEMIRSRERSRFVASTNTTLLTQQDSLIDSWLAQLEISVQKIEPKLHSILSSRLARRAQDAYASIQPIQHEELERLIK